jgi:hypothetical protein
MFSKIGSMTLPVQIFISLALYAQPAQALKTKFTFKTEVDDDAKKIL